jgi:hypothetical protein
MHQQDSQRFSLIGGKGDHPLVKNILSRLVGEIFIFI